MKKCKNKRADALGVRGHRLELQTKSGKIRGLCIEGWVDNYWNSSKKCKIKRVYALGGGWTMIELQKECKIRGFMH